MLPSPLDIRAIQTNPIEFPQFRLKTRGASNAGAAQPRAPGVRCRPCNLIFPSRRQLYEHQFTVHQQGRGELQREPWDPEDAPWEGENGLDEDLRRVYQLHRLLILQGHHEGEVHSEYNFPISNEFQISDLMSFANFIYDRQQMSYRLNLNFAYILRHRETRELRYFRAVGQHGLFDSPIVISSRTDLKKLLIKLRNMNLNEFLLQQRPDTKWSVELVTNVLFSVYKSRFLLGAKEVEMPDYIRNNPSINCLTKNAKTDATYTDNLCLFRCLASHKGQDVRSVEIPARQLFQEWANFKGLETTPPDFQGLNMDRDMHNFDDFYKINVEIYSLDLSGAAKIQYRSHNLHSETMYLNLHETHLSYIRNFLFYAKKYQCKFCKQLWNDYKEHKRHEIRCKNKTKYVYPGGFYK